MSLVIQDKRPSRLDDPPLSDEAWEVIQRCWEREPWKRQGMKDVIESLIAVSQSISPTANARNYEMLMKESLPAPPLTFSNTVRRANSSIGNALLMFESPTQISLVEGNRTAVPSHRYFLCLKIRRYAPS